MRDAQEVIVEAARLARYRVELPTIEEALWAEASAAGASYAKISQGIALELARQGVPVEVIDDTGTGPDNIRKRLARRQSGRASG